MTSLASVILSGAKNLNSCRVLARKVQTDPLPQTPLLAVMKDGCDLLVRVNDVSSLEEVRRLDRSTQPRDQRGESSEGSN